LVNTQAQREEGGKGGKGKGKKTPKHLQPKKRELFQNSPWEKKNSSVWLGPRSVLWGKVNNMVRRTRGKKMGQEKKKGPWFGNGGCRTGKRKELGVQQVGWLGRCRED